MTVDSQITDSVVQVNTAAVVETPAVAGGNLMMTTSHALSMSVQNALASQQQSNIFMQSAMAQNIDAISTIQQAVIERVDEDIAED